MGDTLKRLAFSLGLTKSMSRELTEIIEEEAVFEGKHPETRTYTLHDSRTGMSPDSAMVHFQTNYFSNFRTDTHRLEFCSKEFYENLGCIGLSPGERVMLRYQDSYRLVSDYVPPDFSHKQQTGREHIRRVPIDAVRL